MKSVSKTPTSGQTSHSSAAPSSLEDEIRGVAALVHELEQEHEHQLEHEQEHEHESQLASRVGSPSASNRAEGGKAEPPSPAQPLPNTPQFAFRLSDGAVLMAIDDHAEDRDLSGREVWRAFVLTAEENELAWAALDNAGHDAASRIAANLPKR